MRIKLLEAMVRGKAIVTTSLGAEGLRAIDGTHLLLADGAAEFAAALDRLTQDADYRIALGRAAADHARTHFSDAAVGGIVAAELANFAP
jgi:glycosyltransferase involved in cell wall biosynthesis